MASATPFKEEAAKSSLEVKEEEQQVGAPWEEWQLLGAGMRRWLCCGWGDLSLQREECLFSAQAVPCSCSGCGGDSTDKRVHLKTMQVTSQAKQKTLVLGQEKSFFNQVGGSGLLQAMLLWKGSWVPAALKPAALALLPCPAACFLQASVESVPLKLT